MREHLVQSPEARRLALLFAIVYFAQGMIYLPDQVVSIVFKEAVSPPASSPRSPGSSRSRGSSSRSTACCRTSCRSSAPGGVATS